MSRKSKKELVKKYTNISTPKSTALICYKNDGKVVVNKEEPDNVERLLYVLDIGIKYNEITNEIELDGFIKNVCLKGRNIESVAQHIRGAFTSIGLKLSRQDFYDNLRAVAEKYRYNPIKDYLNSCQKKHGDEVGQINLLLSSLILEEDTDRNFSYMLLKKWLIGIVKMVFNDNGNTSVQGVLIFKGKQGIGKTRFLYSLLPNYLSNYLKDGLKLSSRFKDDLINMLRYTIIELGEFGSTLTLNKIDDLKAIITSPMDSIRLPYRRDVEQFPRRCSFMGTINDDKFLKDDTGERRWWIIPVSNFKALPAGFDINKLWGEVMTLAFKHNIPHWLNQEEIDLLNIKNIKYKSESNEEHALKDKLDWELPISKWRKITATELCEELNSPGKAGYNPAHMGRALQRLKNNGTEPYCLITLPTNKKRIYTVPPKKRYYSQFEKDMGVSNFLDE